MPVIEVPGLGDVEFPDDTPREAMELSIKRALLEKQGKALQQNPRAVMEQEIANPTPPTGGLPPEVRAEGQRSALADAQRTSGQLARNVLVPAAQAGIGFATGGMSIPAQMAIGAGVEAGAQATGLAPRSNTQVALAGLIPPVAHGVVGAAKRVFQGTGAMVAPQVAREAGVEAAAQKMGAPAKSIDRLAHAPKASEAAYRAASQQGDVPLGGVNSAILDQWDKLTNMANAPTRATKYLENLSNKYAGKATTSYEDLMDELQLMRSAADKAAQQKDPVTARALRKARGQILDEMDRVSPALKKANAMYRREQAVEEMTQILRSANPNNKIRNLFESDALVSGAFSKKETQEIYDIADKLASIGVQGSPYSGVTAKIFNTVAAPIAGLMATRTGRTLLRQTFKDGVTPQGLHVAAQFGRAYLAQGGEEP